MEEKEKRAQEILQYPTPYKTRGFEEVVKEHIKHQLKDKNGEDISTTMPTKGSKNSAGYDFYSKENIVLKPGEKHVFWTDVKSYMLADEVLKMYVRSSTGIKKDLILRNQVGIIDCVPAGTMIKTNDGEIEVEKLMEEEKIIMSYNEINGNIEEDKLEDIWTVVYGELIEIETETEKIRIPENKEIYTKRGWIKAKELNIDDEIFHY